MHKALVTAALLLAVAPAYGASPHFGTPADPARMKAWDISIQPDGTGLPAGKGSVAEGAAVYEEKCVMCHGEKGVGKPSDQLTGGIGTLFGAFIGAAAIIGLENLVSLYTERWQSVLGLMFILIMIFAPEGVIGRVRDLLTRRR